MLGTARAMMPRTTSTMPKTRMGSPSAPGEGARSRGRIRSPASVAPTSTGVQTRCHPAECFRLLADEYRFAGYVVAGCTLEGFSMRIVCVSDTHSYHARTVVPDGDILVHAGD